MILFSILTMISSTAWVKRGFAAEYPTQYGFDDKEMDRITGLARLQLNEARQDLREAEEEEKDSAKIKAEQEKVEQELKESTSDDESDDDDLKEYDMDNYDEDEDEADQGESMGMFGNIKSLAYHEACEQDPYITLDGDFEEETRQELQIKATDNLILATKTEDELSYLEVYVYEDETEINDEDGKFTTTSLYVHHDVMLPSFPLCVEWLDFRVGNTKTDDSSDVGNFAAIGTFEPEIEIWNIDVVDSVYPDLVLGQRPDGEEVVSSKKKKKKIQKKINDHYHVDAVLSLSANRKHRNLLVSGSADTTIKLWDLNTGTAGASFRFHSGKVSAVQWCPTDSTVLLSGGYDRQAIVSDLRINDAEGRRTWKVTGGDIEAVKWDPNGRQFYVATENGQIHKFDAREQGKSLWTLQAHDSEVSSFDINAFVEGYMVTASIDRTVKLWNLSSSAGPSMILSRDLDIGKVFSVGFAPDKEVFGHISVAGSAGELKVWDTMTNRTVREIMGRYLKNFNLKNKVGEKIALVEAGDSESESESSEGAEQDNEDDGFEDYAD